MEKLDKKFYGEIHKAKDNSIVNDDEYIVFLAKDNAFASSLPTYRHYCLVMGADLIQLKMVDEMIIRVNIWRTNNSDKCKVPDAVDEKVLN